LETKRQDVQLEVQSMWRGFFVQPPVGSSYLRQMSAEGKITWLYYRARKTVFNLWHTGCDIRKRILLFMLFWLWKEVEREKICIGLDEDMSSHCVSIFAHP